jgi:26S proteasome regulatory subunit N1
LHFQPTIPSLLYLFTRAGILRNLASYYYKEPTLLFLVRTAQGLAHMGKGLIGLSPYHTDRQLLSGGQRVGGLLSKVVHGEAPTGVWMCKIHVY